MGTGGWPPVCEEILLLPLPLNPCSSASLILPAPGVEGACLYVCACGYCFVQPLSQDGVLLLPSPFVFVPCVVNLEGYEGNGDPLALLPQSLPQPVSSLFFSGKMPKYRM